jgi:tetratricopeptide (TPR) repeat protein
MKKDEIVALYEAKRYEDFLDEFNNYNLQNKDVELMFLAADLYFKFQQYTKAYNIFLQIKKIEPDNIKAISGSDMCKKIIETSRVNRYADTNTHMDPWFE